MNKSQHTPTPLILSENLPNDIIDVHGDLITRCTSSEDAAFIVKAVNCHEELLAGLKEFVDIDNGNYLSETDYRNSICEAMARARDIIAKAEA